MSKVKSPAQKVESAFKHEINKRKRKLKKKVKTVARRFTRSYYLSDRERRLKVAEDELNKFLDEVIENTRKAFEKAKGKKPMGRPTKKTPDVIKKLERAFAWGSSVEEACLYAGITPACFYVWADEDPDFFDQMKQLQNTPFLIARESMSKEMKVDGELALKFMERKKRNEFSLKTITEAVEPIGGVDIEDIEDDNDDAEENNGTED